MSLAVTFGGSLPSTDRAHVLRLDLHQRLRREHVLDLGGADAVGQRAERAVRRGVAVAANERHARQREALLGADDVADALADVELVVIFEAEQLGVLRQIRDLRRRFPDRDWAGCGRWSARCDRPPAASCPAHAPCGRRGAGPRTPAATSPHGRCAGRCRAGRCRPAARRPDGRPRSCRRRCAALPCLVLACDRNACATCNRSEAQRKVRRDV